MPTTRRRRKQKRNGWDLAHIFQLGCSLNLGGGWGEFGGNGPFTAEQYEEMEECWKQNRERVMKGFVGRRPWYWWIRQGLTVPSDQTAALRSMRELTQAEEEKLREWERRQPLRIDE